MPTRSKSSTRGSSKSRGTPAARTRTASRASRAKNPVTVAKKQVGNTVTKVRRNHRIRNIGTAAAVAAGLITTGWLLKRKG